MTIASQPLKGNFSKPRLHNSYQNIQQNKSVPQQNSDILISQIGNRSRSFNSFPQQQPQQSELKMVFGRISCSESTHTIPPTLSTYMSMSPILPRQVNDMVLNSTNVKNIISSTTKMTQITRLGLGKLVTLALFLIVSISSPVSCVPLNGVGRGGVLEFQELNSIPQQREQSHTSSILETRGDGESLRNVNYVVQPQSQLFLPSVINSPLDLGQGESSQQRFGTEEEQDEIQEANINHQSQKQHQHHHLQKLQRMRRNSGGPSLSIVNPLDVLRQRLLLEIARRKMRQSQNQIMLNADILQKIGRRRRR